MMIKSREMESVLSRAVEKVSAKIWAYQEKDLDLCITSSFQTHSLPLLHLVSSEVPNIPVLFVDTGYHFPESYSFRNRIVLEWGLNIVNVSSGCSQIDRQVPNGDPLYVHNSDRCCYINKVSPLQTELQSYDVWIAGLRRDQTEFRSSLQEEQVLSKSRVKYHPILDWDSRLIHAYRTRYDLPPHPLEASGYLSIGCQPCTRKALDGSTRSGRWNGENKDECGIHLGK